MAARARAALDDQWRSLDSLIDGMARRARGYASGAADESDDDSGAEPVAPGAAAQISTLRAERDQLRRLLATANSELRAAHAEIRALRALPQHSRGVLAQWWVRWSQRRR